MKAIKKLVFICLASILGLCSACMNDNPDFGRDDEGTGNTNQGEGQVRLAGTSVSVSVDVLSRADTVKQSIQMIISFGFIQLIIIYW